jgi:probable O-glycosylation ligase (exosortase A-associated)
MVIEIVTLVSWIIAMVQTKDRIKWSEFNWFYVGFLFVLGLGIPLAAIGPRALEAWQTMAIYFVMLVVATNVADSLPRIRKLIWLMLLIHFYFALKGIYNYNFAPTIYASGERTAGVVGSSFLADENDFALAINLMIPFAFFIFEHARTAYRKFLGAVFLVAYALGVVSSFSRGGWVGLTAVTIFCVVSSKRRAKSAVAVLLVGLAMLMFAPTSYWKEMETVTDVNESTADERIRSWEAAFRMFLDNPIIGVGGGNAGVHLPNYIQGTTNTARMWGRAVHGTFPEVLADTGALGTAMYLLMMFFVFKYLIRIRQRPPPSEDKGLTMPILATAMIGSIVAYVVTATFLSTAYYPQLWTLYTFALMLYFVYESRMVKIHAGESEVSTTGLPEEQPAD